MKIQNSGPQPFYTRLFVFVYHLSVKNIHIVIRKFNLHYYYFNDIFGEEK